MPYIIDGHNLIPKIPGINLQDINDELQLIKLLQEFCRINRKQVEVYFDNAPPGSPQSRKYGSVTARFIHQGKTADQAIQRKIKQLAGEARNWTVVSSDREVQVNARTSGAKILPAEVFAGQLIGLVEETNVGTLKEDRDLSPQEVEDWLRFFGIDDKDEDNNF
jgi:predicted RNA-binding protein with PIN domain